MVYCINYCFVVILVTLCYVTGKIMIAHRPGLLSFFWLPNLKKYCLGWK